MKHTPGEWNTKLANRGTFIISTREDGKQKIVCQINDVIDGEEYKANARLIAVALEMLEALKQIVHLEDELCKCPSCKIGKPVIKKAEGN